MKSPPTNGTIENPTAMNQGTLERRDLRNSVPMAAPNMLMRRPGPRPW